MTMPMTMTMPIADSAAVPEEKVPAAPTAPAASALELIAINARIARTFRRNVPSPCISVCRLTPDTRQCEGCLRTVDEIRGWGMASDERKLAVWALVEQRARELLAQQPLQQAGAAAPAATPESAA